MSADSPTLQQNQTAATAAPVGDAEKLFRRRLGGLRMQIVRHRLWLGLTIVLPVLVGMCLMSWLVDWAFRLELGIRAALLVAMLGGAAWAARKALRLTSAPLTDDALALALERAHGSFRDRLISAVQFLRQRSASAVAVPAMTRSLEDRVILDAATALRDAPSTPMLRNKRLAGMVAATGILAGLLGTSVAQWPEGFGVWLQRNVLLQDVRWPRNTNLALIGHGESDEFFEVEPGRAWLVPAGDAMLLRVSASGVSPASVEAQVKERRDNGREMDGPGVTFIPRDGEWVGAWPTVNGSMQVRIFGGDDDIGPFEVTAVPRPEVSRYDVRVTPPTYTGAGVYEATANGTDVRCLRQSQILIRAEVSTPLQRIEVDAGDGSDLQFRLVEQDGRYGFNCWMTADRDRMLTVRLVDQHGFGSAPDEPFRLRIVALPDREPRRVVVVADGLSDRITPFARLALKISASDDWGLTAGSLALSVQRPDGNTATQDLPASGISGAEAQWTARAEVQPLQPQIGDFVMARATVQDNNTMDGPNSGSGELQFRVVSPEELSGELLERLNAARRRFEDLLRRHKTNAARFDRWVEMKIVGDDEGNPIPASLLGTQIADITAQQRTVTDGSAEVAAQYAALLRELWLNRLVKDNEHAAQQRLVVTPLQRLLESGLRPLRDSLRKHALANRGGDAPPPEDQVASAFRRAARQMEEILDSMQRLETFTEVLHDLQSALDAHQKAIDQTQAARDQATADFLRGEKDKDGDGKDD